MTWSESVLHPIFSAAQLTAHTAQPLYLHDDVACGQCLSAIMLLYAYPSAVCHLIASRRQVEIRSPHLLQQGHKHETRSVIE